MDYPLSFDEFKSIYSKVPRCTVEVLIVKDGKILLAKRSIEPYKGMWHTPGGTVYFRETLVEAAKRIAKNEIGVDIKVDKFVGIIEYASEIDNYFGHSISHVYECKIINGTPSNRDQSDKVEYFAKIPDNTLPEQKIFYEEYLSKLNARSD